MTCSMAMCGFINMSIVKTGATLVSQREEAHFLQRCRAFAAGCACLVPVQGMQNNSECSFRSNKSCFTPIDDLVLPPLQHTSGTLSQADLHLHKKTLASQPALFILTDMASSG